jgi:SAM-dependent methyltransferase
VNNFNYYKELKMLPSKVIDDIKIYLSRVNVDDTPEIEIRMRNFDLQNGGVPLREYRRIMQTLKERKHYPIIEYTTNYVQGKVRKTVDNYKQQTSWMQKEEIYSYLAKDYSIKVAINKEITIKEPINFNSELIREKYRNSYIFKDLNYRIDLTEVSTAPMNGKRFTTYEVEIELIEPWKNQSLITNLNNIISDVYKILKGTYDLYTDSQRQTIIKYVNTTLGSSKPFFDMNNIAQARNLKLKDLVYGGLVGHPDITYTVTHKADGLRKLICVHDTGLWMFIADDFNRISFESLAEVMKGSDLETLLTYQGFIIEGELITNDKRLKGSSEAVFWLLCFDCLSTPRDDNKSSMYGSKNVQEEPHTSRLERAKTLTDLLKNSLIEVSMKTFLAVDTPSLFFERMSLMFGEIATLNYKEDGFMFTPVETRYNTGTNNVTLKERGLTKFPEIVKWKHIESLTIDLEVQWEKDGNDLYLQLFSGPDQRNEPKVLFEGSKINPLDDQVDIEHALLRNVKTGTIIEFRWDRQRNLLTPLQIRDDKLKPNKNEIVLDVWEDIFDPIDQNTMIGSSLRLMRKYHNRIKRGLFDYSKGNTLLDIGSGRGGDVSKWFMYSKVVAVEPNLENFKELRRRVELFNMTDKVFLVNTIGEDTLRITQAVNTFIGTRVDVVSTMLSLSYFWKDQDTVNKLFNTIASNISPKGKYLFFTLDGDTVENLFDPKFGKSISLKDLSFGDYFKIKYNSDSSIDTFIKGSILENYSSLDTGYVKEWLVRIDDLTSRFLEYGFKITHEYRADKEEFLSLPEKVFSKLFTYGIFENVFEGKSLFALQNDTRTLQKVFPVRLNNYETTTIPTIPTLDIVTYKKSDEDKIVIANTVIKQKIEYYSPTFQEIETRRLNKISTSSKMSENKVMIPKFDKKKLEKIRKPEKKERTLVPKPFGDILISPSKQPPLKKTENIPLLEPQTIKNVTLLNYLKVTFSPYFGDDIVQEVQDKTFKDKIVRIATIEDGSSLFHCILKAAYPDYVKVNDFRIRRRMAREIRRDLAFILSEQDPDDESRIYYETLNNGSYVGLYEERLLYDKISDEQKIDFSLSGLQILLNSNEPIYHEIMPIISELMGIDVIVCILTEGGVAFESAPGIDGTNRDVVVVSRNEDHYELMGIYVREKDNLKIQCLFPFDHPFVERTIKSSL